MSCRDPADTQPGPDADVDLSAEACQPVSRPQPAWWWIRPAETRVGRAHRPRARSPHPRGGVVHGRCLHHRRRKPPPGLGRQPWRCGDRGQFRGRCAQCDRFPAPGLTSGRAEVIAEPLQQGRVSSKLWLVNHHRRARQGARTPGQLRLAERPAPPAPAKADKRPPAGRQHTRPPSRPQFRRLRADVRIARLRAHAPGSARGTIVFPVLRPTGRAPRERCQKQFSSRREAGRTPHFALPHGDHWQDRPRARPEHARGVCPRRGAAHRVVAGQPDVGSPIVGMGSPVSRMRRKPPLRGQRRDPACEQQRPAEPGGRPFTAG